MLYVFEGYALDTDLRELRRGAELVAVEPQVFDLLAYLIRNRDRVASRDDLLEAVWSGRIVSESTLSSRINAARVAIGDSGEAQRFIRTLPRKGVRFVGTVKEERDPPKPPDAAAAEPPAPGRPVADGPAIAVLPFNNMSGDPENDYFADGMAEEIITALSHCSGLTVIARNSSFAYKGRSVDVREVGRELGVGYVLEGSVRRSVDRLRITAQLIETNAGGHLWADRFDGKLADVFELQDRIAESAAAVIEPRMRFAEVEREKRKPTHSMHAYDLWLRALSAAREFTAASMESALDCLDRALAIDSAYALALATSAYYRAHCHMQGWRREPDDIQARDVRRAWDAVELAKDDANVLWMSAFAIWTLARDAPRAAELFRRSLALNPNSAIALTMAGWLEATNGNAAGGRKMIERSQRLNPNHPTPWLMSTGMAIACIAEGKFQEAIPWAEKALLHNRRFAVALRALAVALVHSGRIERARAIVQELVALEPGLTVSAIRTRLPHVFEPILNAYTDALGKAGLPE